MRKYVSTRARTWRRPSGFASAALEKRILSTGVPTAKCSGRRETLFNMAVGPLVSRPCTGPAESDRGSPARRPSGLAPTCCPACANVSNMICEGRNLPPRRHSWDSISVYTNCAISAARESTLSISLPNFAQCSSICRSGSLPSKFSRRAHSKRDGVIAVRSKTTSRIASRESATLAIPATFTTDQLYLAPPALKSFPLSIQSSMSSVRTG